MTKLSGGLNNWYVVPVAKPQRKEQEPYQAECEDIIQALGMTFDEGCAFKALWRNAAARLGNGKPGNTAVYDAEKLVHYANRILNKEKIATEVIPLVGDPGNSNWIYSKMQPNITRPYTTVIVEYDNGMQFEYDFLQYVRWPDVKRYRVVYK